LEQFSKNITVIYQVFENDDDDDDFLLTVCRQQTAQLRPAPEVLEAAPRTSGKHPDQPADTDRKFRVQQAEVSSAAEQRAASQLPFHQP
jgi:hypothetical protein